MFELQNAKRSVRAITLQSHNANPRRSVTRSELHSTFSSPDSVDSEDDDAKDRWRRQLDQIYQGGLIEQQPEQVSDAADRPQAIDEANDESYEFPLFSQKPRGSTAKILLKSPSPEIKDPGFVQPARPQDYYFTAAESRHCQGRFGDVAVEGHDVVRESLVKWVRYTRAMLYHCRSTSKRSAARLSATLACHHGHLSLQQASNLGFEYCGCRSRRQEEATRKEEEDNPQDEVTGYESSRGGRSGGSS